MEAQLADNEQGLVRFQGLRLVSMPPWSSGHDVRLSTGKGGFDSRRGYCLSLLPVGEKATPPVSGTGDRWFDSSRADCAVEERLSSRAS